MPDHSPIEALLALRTVERLPATLQIACAELSFHAERIKRQVRAQSEMEYFHLESLRADYLKVADTLMALNILHGEELPAAGRVAGVLANYLQGRLERREADKPEPLSGVEDGIAAPVVEDVN